MQDTEYNIQYNQNNQLIKEDFHQVISNIIKINAYFEGKKRKMEGAPA